MTHESPVAGKGPDVYAFVASQLAASGMTLTTLSEDVMRDRLGDIMTFVNGVRTEYGPAYGWKPEPKEYFLNGLHRKWEFSSLITDTATGTIAFVGLVSVYETILHLHCAYAAAAQRRLGLGKFFNLQLCQTGLDRGFAAVEGYWPKENNGSIILFLRMGYHIDDLRKNGTQLLLSARLEESRARTLRLIEDDRELAALRRGAGGSARA